MLSERQIKRHIAKMANEFRKYRIGGEKVFATTTKQKIYTALYILDDKKFIEKIFRYMGKW